MQGLSGDSRGEVGDGFGRQKNYKGSIDLEIAKASGYALVKYASKNMSVLDFSLCIKTFDDGVTKAWIEDLDGKIKDQTYGEDGGESQRAPQVTTRRKRWD